MPELPEVETITRQLNKALAGKIISHAEILLPKIVKLSAAQFQNALKDAKIKAVYRRAKILIFELSNGQTMLMHLKLSGQLILNGQKSKHTHLIFHFTDKSHLIFNDQRQFGYVKLIATADLPELFKKEGIGPEPLQNDFALADFETILRRRPKTKIKQFLMDQKNIAGIGNIYADEILFYAGVHPLRHAQTLKNAETKKIFSAIKKILTEAIALKGTSADLYLDAYGHEGSYLSRLKIFGREGEKCVKCKGEVKRIKLGGRSAHFCPKCQK